MNLIILYFVIGVCLATIQLCVCSRIYTIAPVFIFKRENSAIYEWGLFTLVMWPFTIIALVIITIVEIIRELICKNYQ